MYKVILLDEKEEKMVETRCNTFQDYANFIRALDKKYVLLLSEFVEVEFEHISYFNRAKDNDLVEGADNENKI